ncbi:TIGR02466 family protein [Streptomyces sp. NBC_01304]|uniref:TIGR02466 family protein n=1 Tax=Streptomyces sp. NBC_01304 TaxID=2903818 RepID=UPI002E0F2B1B|nr:2OG-Fe(II) oxygenase family protein [Streptomyces sp. NBC_01304]
MATHTQAGWQARGAGQDMWPTPIYLRTTPTGEDTEALADQILAREAADPSITLGAAHARKSASDLLTWPLPAITALNGWIRDAALAVTQAGPDTRLSAEAWAVHYQLGGYHEVHAHHDSAVSGVYYLRTTEATEATGALELHDPRPARAATAPADVAALHAVVPHAGLLIAFPSWLRHGVAPHNSETPRLCIAFNISMEAAR